MTTVTTPTTPKTGISELDTIQLHTQASNALAMAAHYLHQPVSNIPGAARKAVQALSALNQLKIASFGPEANDSGRA